ncbi:MAG: hypothetical protein LBR36_03950 [Bacteroidales bacterium]|jgi:hypothetical protein|nr:hypothetical protein [Bacteroidales bacterium]
MKKGNRIEPVKFSQSDCEKLWKMAGNPNGSQKNGKPFDFKIYQSDSMAILELNNFGVDIIKNYAIKYSDFLNYFFDSINKLKIKHLFIDLSANGGGSDEFGYEMLSYLIKDSVYYLGKFITKTSTELKRFWRLFDKYVYGDYLKKGKNKRFFCEEQIWTPQTNDTIYYYKNNVYLIQSDFTASAALSVVSFVKSYIGITVGEPALEGAVMYASVLFFKMPHSKLSFMCPTKYGEFFGANQLDRSHLQPHVAYPITDPTKSFTLEQLKDMLQKIKIYKKEKMLE